MKSWKQIAVQKCWLPGYIVQIVWKVNTHFPQRKFNTHLDIAHFAAFNHDDNIQIQINTPTAYKSKRDMKKSN